MAKNYIEDGKTLDWQNTGAEAVNGGDPVAVGVVVGIAHDDIAVSATGVLHMTGVFDLPKTSTDTWAQGVKLYLASGKLTATAGSNPVAGIAWGAAAAGSTIAAVRLGG
ncbi:capsid cement protein [Salmonella enterica]